MIKQILISIVILIIAMNLFSNVDKLQNYSTFQNSVFVPLDVENEEVTEIEPPKVGTDMKLFSDFNNFVPFNGIKELPTKESQPEVAESKTSSLDKLFAKNLFDTNSIPGMEFPSVIAETNNNVSLKNNIPGSKAELKSAPKAVADIKRIRKLNIKGSESQVVKYLMKGLAGAESSYNPKQITASGLNGTFGSGAWGKYQFIRRDHEDKIKKVTGLNMKQFLNDEKAQDKYFQYHYLHELKPKLIKIREMGLGKQYSDVELLGALHYRNNNVIPILQKNQANVKFNDNKINPTLNGHMSKVLKYANSGS